MTPLRCGTQVEPPSVVRRIVPPSPTAVPVFASLNQTLRSSSALPAESGVQDVPPVDVPTVIPNAPRATPVEALQLAQQATLETRDPKHEPRSLTEQRTVWHAEAAVTLGGTDAVQSMISKALKPISTTSPHVDAEWLAATAEKVLAAMEERRSTWQSWHVRAEAQRHVRAAQLPTDMVEQLVELLVAEVLQTRSVALAWTDDNITEPAVLRRADGSSVYTVAGSELFTSARILSAEQRLVATAGRTDGRVVDTGTVELALLESAANGNALDAGQAVLVRSMCTSGARLQLAIAPAGAGKTTAMRSLERQSRPGRRTRPIRHRGRAAPRCHRTSGNAGEAHLVHPPWWPAGLG